MSAQRRFASGDCYAVVSPTAIVVLPATEQARVGVLWEAADTGASPDELLDALLAGGLSGLQDFAWVGVGAESTRLIVRGSASARVSTESVDHVVRAGSGLMWEETVLAHDCTVRLGLGDEAPAEHSLMPGISLVQTIEWSSGAEQPVVHNPVVLEPVVDEPAVEQPVAEEPVAEEPRVDAPFIDAPFAVAEAEPHVELSMIAGTPAESLDVVDEPQPAPAVDWSDRDGQTIIGTPTPDFDRPPIPGQEIAPDVVSHAVASLVFSTGDVIAVDRTVLVGRAPEARQFASHDQPRVVTVSSPHQEISSTHLEIRPGAGADHGSAIATDLGSTNGTMLVQPGLAPEELQPGIAVSLIPGAVLDLGDGVTIQVTDP